MTNPDIKHKLILKILNGDYSERELVNFKTNNEKLGNQDLVDAVEEQMRKQFPKAANKQFGAKPNDLLEMLTKTFNEIQAEFDLSNNHNLNKVKVGGLIKSKKYVADHYISYRNKATNVRVSFGIKQESHTSEAIVHTTLRKIGSNADDKESFYTMKEYDTGLNEYKSLLREIISQSA